MKKIFLLTPLFFLFNIINSQEEVNAVLNDKKKLTIENAVLGYYKGLYPKNLSDLAWTLNNQYVYQNENEYVILNPNQSHNSKNKKSITIESINSVNKNLGLKSLPWGAKIKY